MQVAHSGASWVPPRMRSTFPHPVQRPQRWLQAWHHGWPVAVEIMQGALLAQIPQTRIVLGRHAEHRGPSFSRTWTGRRCPHPVQVSWLMSAMVRHGPHQGRPCSSRVQGSRTAPQRAHGSARDLARQLRHSRSPERALVRVITRPQFGQGGRTRFVAPPWQRTSISFSTLSTGAWAPAPVSRSGRSASAHASRRRAPARGVIASTAAVTVSMLRAGSMPRTISVTTARGSRSSSGPHPSQRARPCRSREPTGRV